MRKCKIGKIGFVIENAQPYWEAMASTRLRCYDIIHFLKSSHYDAELYCPGQNYDIIIFQKCFKDEHIRLAKTLNANGTIVVLDINVNYINEDKNSEFVKKEQNENIKKMMKICDHLIVSSPMLLQIYSRYHSSVFCIEENVHQDFFKIQKKIHYNNDIYLVYCGYSVKAKEIYIIKDVLVQLYKDFGIKMLYITEKDPEINIIPYKFINYNQKDLPRLLTEGDIKVAPRDIKNPYNIGHSFTKVAYPMAVGLPAIASPVPSYLNREVIICNNENEWYDNLVKLICNPKLRDFLGKKGSDFVKNNFSITKIGSEYIRLFDYLLDK